MSPAEQAKLQAVEEFFKKQATKDMVLLARDKRFIRLMADLKTQVGLHAIQPGQPGDVFYREGRRSVVEALMSDLAAVDLEASFEVDRVLRRRAIIRANARKGKLPIEQMVRSLKIDEVLDKN